MCNKKEIDMTQEALINEILENDALEEMSEEELLDALDILAE